MSSDTTGLVAGASLVALFGAGIVHLVYNAAWPVALGLGSVFGIVGFLLLRNRENNVRKWQKNPTTFPNPLGGGIVGEYMKRPWREELAEIGRAQGRRGRKKLDSSKSQKDRKEEE